MADDENVGTLVVASAGADPQATQVIAQRDASDKPVAFLWTGTRGAQSGLPMLRQAGIPVFYVPDKLAAGVRYLNDYHDWRERQLERGFGESGDLSADQKRAAESLSGGGSLTEFDSKALVSTFGVPTTRDEVATDADGAVAAAERIRYPVAVKVNSPDILHKTEAGGIWLGLTDADAVRAAFDQVTTNARAYDANARIDGVVVQEMVAGGVETIVGVSYDDQLGPFLLFGTGGVMVEVFNDVALAALPHNAGRGIGYDRRGERRTVTARIPWFGACGRRRAGGHAGECLADGGAIGRLAGRTGPQPADGFAGRAGSEGGRRAGGGDGVSNAPCDQHHRFSTSRHHVPV